MKTLALIGVGKWGRNIVSTLEAIADAKLKYLCARNVESLALYGEKYEKMSDWHELLKKKDLAAVLIATPPSTHAGIATPFLEHGIPVFVEKPMVLNVAEAEKLRTLVKQSGKVFMVGYQYLFNDNVRYVKKEIEKGFFGKILLVKSEHLLSLSRPDVDIFGDAGPHPLSVSQYLFDPKTLISAEGKRQRDSVSIKVRFENAPTLEIIASRFGQTKTRKITVTGEKATAVLDETMKKNKLAILKNGKTFYPKIKVKEPLRNEMEHCLHCIQTGNTPLTNVDFGYRITEWLDTISKKLR